MEANKNCTNYNPYAPLNHPVCINLDDEKIISYVDPLLADVIRTSCSRTKPAPKQWRDNSKLWKIGSSPNRLYLTPMKHKDSAHYALFNEVRQAYQVLSNRSYDRWR